ncbi:tetratricopeptide repeat protein [Mesotoga sp. BH458_6_3_2_1]|uniref:tetratricopeptide repeat protein n=1 Tax=Mesotoga sp. BH458_6_3_2_1 TaxID=1437446 RepID=UPI000EF25A1A|nr:tetratricopeptide repeat protein [Mesotoga sp. BH458_6_3_2_1]RLL82413.1 hypothetical protein Y697_07630 [Mesotoga sp. BH458_6_3_2_1]
MNGKRVLLERILGKGTKSREEDEMGLEPEKMERILSEVLAKKSADFTLPDSKESKEKLRRSISSAQEVTRVDAIRGSSLKLDPLNELHYYVRGVDYMMDNLDYAVQDFTRAIQINDTFALAYFARGNVYIMLLEYEKAARDLEKAISLYPNLQWAYIDLAYVYTRQGNRDLSQKCIDQLFEKTLGDDFSIAENDPLWGYPFIGTW